MRRCSIIVLLNVMAVLVGMPSERAVAQQPRTANPSERQVSLRSTKRYVPAKTISGQPDLQGVWSFFTLTPFERPKEFADKAFFTEEEAIAFEKRAADRTACGSVDTGRACNPKVTEKTIEAGDLNSIAAYDNSFFDTPAVSLVRSRRTSQVIDPPDGRIPPLTPEARKRYANAPTFVPKGSPGTPEDLELTQRCIGFHHAPPIRVSPYDNFIEIVQGRDSFVINGQLHSFARVVPTDGRPHLPSTVQQWWGDSRGHWEANTLVIETTNFTNAFNPNVHGADEHLRLTERFTRVDADLLSYEYTVDDATAFTRPWTVAFYMKKAEGTKVYPYTCIESNRAVALILGNARAAEKAAADAASQPKK